MKKGFIQIVPLTVLALIGLITGAVGSYLQYKFTPPAPKVIERTVERQTVEKQTPVVYQTIQSSKEGDSEPRVGSTNFVGGKVYYLFGGGIGSTDTSITLTSFTVPVSGYNLTMADFGTTGYVTIEPSNTSRQEFVSFTGITQNADGTATLTGVVRGLSFVSPYTASTTLQKSHAGGSIVVISNPPQLYSHFSVKDNAESITGPWQYSSTSMPYLDGYLAPTSTVQLATKGYVDNTAFTGAGAIAATETAVGYSELATQFEGASSTVTGSAGPLVLQAKNATSTFNSATAGLRVVVTGNNGKIDGNFIQNLSTTTATSTMIGSFSAYDIGKHIQISTTTGLSSFAVPSGIASLCIQAVGGGGGGGAGDASASGGGGGGAGYSEGCFDVTGTSTIVFNVASGGAGGSAGNNVGLPGGTTTVSWFIQAGGGAGGQVNTGSFGAGGAGGVASSTCTGGCSYNIRGGGGFVGHDDGTQASNGGPSFFGGGGRGATNLVPDVGTAPGSGGGGGLNNSVAGAAGAPGFIIFRW